MDVPTTSKGPSGPPTSLSLIRWVQSRLADWFAVSSEQRQKTALAMMRRAQSERASYWLQLLLSMCIATLGLALSSTGVVIGAMLIAPLMGPIVELAMALTVGSPFLTLRSVFRIAASILVVVCGSAILNLALPYHEVTSEIAARTTPTAVDLFVAIFCAFAAAFSVVRAGSETVATAAGTSISIALVPPLCVVGFGIGNSQWPVARGAMLLFTANLSAILLFAAVFFFCLGFDTVDASDLEHDGAVKDSRFGRLSGRLHRLFGHRYGPLLRLLIPLLLVGAVYIPLSSALATVAWEVRVRGQVRTILDAEIPRERAVQSSLQIEQGKIGLRVVLVGQPSLAHELESRLRLRIAQVAGVDPVLYVLAVPDEQTVRDTAQRLAAPRPVRMPSPPEPDYSAIKRVLDERLAGEWPTTAAGSLRTWRISTDNEVVVIEVLHLGPPLGAAAEELLARRIGQVMHVTLRIQDRALDMSEHVFTMEEADRMWPALLTAIESVRAAPGLTLCVGLPTMEPPTRPEPKIYRLQALLDSIRSAASTLTDRSTILESKQPQFRIQEGPCVAPIPTPPGLAPNPQTTTNPRDH